VSREFGPIGSRSDEKFVDQRRKDVRIEQNRNEVYALSLEFVAKPTEAQRAQMAVPAAINSTLQGISGFAGCLVLSADQEMRLMKVITFWKGADAGRHCTRNTRWLCKLLQPYLDGGVKCRTYIAHMPAESSVPVSTFLVQDNEAALPLASKAEEAYVS
jgi:hypothetical protein